MERLKSEDMSTHRPFGLAWLDSCLHETLLPNTPWQKVQEKISERFARRIEKQLNHSDRRQMIFELLGEQFVEKYFPKYPNNPTLIEPPAVDPARKDVLKKEAQAWLQQQLYKAARDVGCQRAPGQDYQADTAPEMVEFVEHTYQVFYTGMDRQLVIEDELRQQEEEPTWKREKRPGRPNNQQQHGDVKRQDRHSTARLQGGKPPQSWGPASDSLGKHVVAVLKRDPRRLQEVCSRLLGKQLPGTLRMYVWTDVLMKEERRKIKDHSVNVEKMLRERFGRGIVQGVQALKLKSATRSPISGLVENAVIEMYDRTPGMQAYSQPEQLKEAARVLNILYTYDRSYEPYLIHWLFPLQLVYKEGCDQEEHPYELAMYLKLLIDSRFPKWPEVFAIAERVMDRLKQEDRHLHRHLVECSLKNVSFDPKDFLVQLIHKEKEQAQAGGKGGQKPVQPSPELLANPLIFVRKWVGEGFVSVLDAQAVLLVWDQAFMTDWKHKVLEDFCLVILLLLRDLLLQATDYHTMKGVLLLEPCRLYTADIQRGWMHLQQGGLPADLPTLNRRRPSTAVPARTPLRTRPEVPPSPGFDLEPDELGPVGLRNFKVKLILLRQRPGEGMSEGEEDWVAHFDHKNVRLTASVYFGDIKLRSKSTVTEPRLKDKKQNLQSNLGEYVDTYSIEFKEDLIFNNLDPSQFHGVDFGPDSQPYAIVRASYRGKGEDDKASVPVNLGWVKIPVYRQELSQDAAGEGGPPMRGARPHWDVIEGEQTITIVPGNVPETAVGKVPRSFTDKDVVREGSMLYATVFDPSADQKGEDSDGEEESDADVVPTVDSDPFVFFNPETAEDQPPVPDNSEGIDLYVDRVQFIPDNATIIKVTGRVMKSNLDNLPDISAFAELDSSARSPQLAYRLPLNTDPENRKPMSHDALVLLRVYTVDKDTKTLLVIGSCLFPLFVEEDGQTRFNVGGHQLRLRRGMPDTKKPLLASSLDNVIPVPGASILLRLMPHGEEMIPAPPYKNGFYHSEKSRPNMSEMRILRDFQSDTLFPLSVREAIHRLQIAQGMPPSEEESDAALEQWYRDRLDAKKHLPPRTPASHSDLLRAVRYHIQTGIGIQVEQAHGVNGEGLYVNVFARVSPGAEARELENTPEGYGGEDKIISTKHDFSSLQKSPKWLDPPSIIHPHLEPNTCLLIQVFGLDAVYTPQPEGSAPAPGTVSGKRGQEVRLTTESQLGWTAVPLFDRGCVMAGVHNVPLFMGMPSTEFLTNIAVKSVELSMKEALNTGSDRLCKEYSSLVVKVYDAHYNPEECIPIPVRDELLKIDNVSKFKKTMGGVKSKPLSQLVLQSLDKKLQKQGTGSEVYQREEGFYDEAMGDTFYNLMENALMNAGYGPL